MPEMTEKPVKRPIMPPTQEILSEIDILASLVIWTGVRSQDGVTLSLYLCDDALVRQIIQRNLVNILLPTE